MTLFNFLQKNKKKAIQIMAISLLAILATFTISAFQAQALTVADYNGVASACPDKYPNNTKRCTTFINSITVNGFTDNNTELSSRATPIPYGYIIPNQKITISWTKNGSDSSPVYLIKFGCGNSVDLANDDNTIGWTDSTNISWNVPSWVSNYKYCKIWVYAKTFGLSLSNNPTLGVSNTRPFLMQSDMSVSCSAYPSSAEEGTEIKFTASVSGGSQPYQYTWSGDVSGYSQTVYKTFNTKGTYTAYVTVLDNAGQSKKASCNVTITQKVSPLSVYCKAYPSSAEEGTEIKFTAYGSGGVKPYSYSWSGDVSGSSQSTYKTFYNAGTYAAYIRLTDSNGNTTNSSCSVTITKKQQAQKPTVDLNANPSTVYEGESSTLTWTSTNASYCQASGGWSGQGGPSGSFSTGPLYQTTTYTLTCYGDGGSASDSVTVTVLKKSTPPPAVQYGYNCNYSTGQCYYTTNGTFSSLSECSNYCTPPVQPQTRYSCNQSTGQCYVNSAGQYTDLSSCQSSCQVPQTKYSCNTQTWQCLADTSGQYNDLSSCQNNCKSPAAPTVDLRANPEIINKGQSSTLTWTSTNASYCNASGGWSGDHGPTSGSFTATPDKTTTYTLTCYGDGGSASDSVTITVNDTVPTVTINANPSLIDKGQVSTLTWTSTNASYCQASGAWSGNKNVYGSENVYPSTSSSYYITCYNSSGNYATAYTNITVRELYPIIDLSVYPSTITQGQTAILSWSGTNISSCTASSSLSSNFNGYRNPSGSEQTAPSQTTTYTLNCLGTNGQYVSDSVTLNVVAPTSDQLLTLTKLGRNITNGERNYAKVVKVTSGNVVEFYLQINNISNKTAYNVIVKETLPAELSYYTGSTKIDSNSAQDGISVTGLNLGNLEPGASRLVTFYAIAQTPTNLFAVTNVAEVKADNADPVTDSTTVTYSAVAGAATIRTGAWETLWIIVGISGVSSGGIWYCVNKTAYGKQLVDKFKEKSVQRKINKMRIR